jgi:hypothetical protein
MAMLLSVNPSTQAVGYATIFTITGGPPKGTIAWSSTLNGKPTGEDHSEYPGQVLDDNGNWSASGGNWPASMVGSWTKTAYVYPPDSTPPWVATVGFTVVPGQGAVDTPPPVTGGVYSAPPPVAPSGSSFFSGHTTLPLVGSVPNVALIGGGAVLVLLLTSGGGGRR